MADRERDDYWHASARGNFSGEWARDPREDLSDNYARERWGGSGASGDFYGRGRRGGNTAAVGYGPARNRSTYGDNSLGGSAAAYGGMDPMARVSYRGRGPKNYRRADDRIADELHRRLTDDPDLDASNIEFRVENGEVTLEGAVRDRSERRLAEDIAFSCRGVHDVHNRLRTEEPIGKASE